MKTGATTTSVVVKQHAPNISNGKELMLKSVVCDAEEKGRQC